MLCRLPALYNGATRTRTLEVFVDGVSVTEWTSSGTTDDFESIDMSGSSGRLIELVAVLAPTEWISIVEVRLVTLCMMRKNKKCMQEIAEGPDIMPLFLKISPLSFHRYTYQIQDMYRNVVSIHDHYTNVFVPSILEKQDYRTPKDRINDKQNKCIGTVQSIM